jgi:hypothetical protein
MADTGFLTASTVGSVGWTLDFTTINLSTSNNARALATSTTYLSGLISNFGFSLPSSANIDGIEVTTEFSDSSALATASLRLSLSGNGGAVYTSTVENTVAGVTDTVRVYGGPTDLWGGSWPVSAFDTANFFVKVEGKSSVATTSCRLDYIAVKVYYTENNANFFMMF